MTQRRRAVLEAVLEVLSDYEAASVEVTVTGSGHHMARFVHNGRKLAYVFSSTAGDRRTVLNTRAGVRRLILNNAQD